MNTTRISNTLQKALNDQIILEAFSAQMYLMLACWADENKITDLKSELQKMRIEFFEDKIPFYGIDRPVYRVFVLG